MIILYFFVGFPLLIYLFGPIIIWKSQKIPTRVKFQPLDEDTFMNQRNEKFREYAQSLEQLGFISVGSSILQDRHTDSHFTLFWQQKTRLAALVTTIKSKVDELTYLEISQKYTDGSILDVSNSAIQEAYPQLDIKRAYRFPKMGRADELLHAHAKIRVQVCSDLHALDYDISQGFQAIELFLKKESDALLEIGLVKKDIDSEGKRALTLWGAFVITYRAIPPGKNILGFVTEKRAEKVLQKLDRV